jgi:nitrogen fixation-related uncharacterized protein
MGLTGAAGIAICFFEWPSHSGKYSDPVQPWLVGFFAYALAFTSAALWTRPTSEARGAKAIRAVLLVQMAIYAFFWGSLGFEELIDRPVYTKILSYVEIHRMGWRMQDVPRACMYLGILMRIWLPRSFSRWQPLAVVEVVGCPLMLSYDISMGLDGLP